MADEVTVRDLVNRTRRNVVGSLRERVNWLNGAVTISDETFTMLDDPSTWIQPSMRLEVGEEICYVRSVSGSDVTVRRGWDGSTAKAHQDDELVRVNPLVTTHEIVQLLQSELEILNGSGIAVFESTNITYDHTKASYDLLAATSNVTRLLGVYDVTYEAGDDGHHRPVRWRLHRHRHAGDYPSEFALEILQGGQHGEPLRVIYKRSMEPLGDLDDAVDVPTYAVDVLPAGAAWRFLLAQEASRVSPRAEHGSRRAEEVPPNANSFAARAFQRMREDLTERALERQLQEYPIQMRD